AGDQQRRYLDVLHDTDRVELRGPDQKGWRGRRTGAAGRAEPVPALYRDPAAADDRPILRTQALAGGAGHHSGGGGGSPGSASQLRGPSLLLGVIMVSIDVHGACVDFPIFDAKTRSLKKAVLGTVGRAGGKIGVDAKVPIIEALRNITISLRHGDRVGLIGH